MIAESFNDLGQVKLYITYCKKYPLNVIYRAFSEAKNFPEAKIKKSRAAIFFYLIKTYSTDQTRILAIDPGTREIGVAIL